MALFVIGSIKLDLATGEFILRFYRACAQALIFATVEKPAHLARLELFLVNVQRLQQTLDGRLLVRRIEDLESLRKMGVAIVGSQQTIAQSVKGTDPHAAGIDRHHRRQAGQHFFGCFIGKSHCQNACRADLAGLNQIGNAGGEYSCLATAGTREHQRALARQRDSLQLFGIEIVEKPGMQRGSNTRWGLRWRR